jgi:hypothetical protein
MSTDASRSAERSRSNGIQTCVNRSLCARALLPHGAFACRGRTAPSSTPAAAVRSFGRSAGVTKSISPLFIHDHSHTLHTMPLYETVSDDASLRRHDIIERQLIFIARFQCAGALARPPVRCNVGSPAARTAVASCEGTSHRLDRRPPLLLPEPHTPSSLTDDDGVGYYCKPGGCGYDRDCERCGREEARGRGHQNEDGQSVKLWGSLLSKDIDCGFTCDDDDV